MHNALLLSLLSRDGSGLLIAAAVALLGGLLRLLGAPGLAVGLVLALALLLAAGAAWHGLQVRQVMKQHPAPGRMVDAGGFKLHLLAEGGDGEARGLVKVIKPPGSDKILGMTSAGEHAGDLLVEYVAAMKHGFGLNKILGTIHIYPTLGEANMYAAGVWKKAQTTQ